MKAARQEMNMGVLGLKWLKEVWDKRVHTARGSIRKQKAENM